jgi:hypothetical protein
MATLRLLGVEGGLVGGFAMLVSLHLGPRPILGIFVFVTVAAVIFPRFARRSAWVDGHRVGAVCLSFLATIPGLLQVITQNRTTVPIPYACYEMPVPCYEMPGAGFAELWWLVGPVLLLASLGLANRSVRRPAERSPASVRFSALPIFALTVVHLVAWLIGARSSFLCAMTV